MNKKQEDVKYEKMALELGLVEKNFMKELRQMEQEISKDGFFFGLSLESENTIAEFRKQITDEFEEKIVFTLSPEFEKLSGIFNKEVNIEDFILADLNVQMDIQKLQKERIPIDISIGFSGVNANDLDDDFILWYLCKKGVNELLKFSLEELKNEEWDKKLSQCKQLVNKKEKERIKQEKKMAAEKRKIERKAVELKLIIAESPFDLTDEFGEDVSYSHLFFELRDNEHSIVVKEFVKDKNEDLNTHLYVVLDEHLEKINKVLEINLSANDFEIKSEIKIQQYPIPVEVICNKKNNVKIKDEEFVIPYLNMYLLHFAVLYLMDGLERDEDNWEVQFEYYKESLGEEEEIPLPF